MSAIWGVISRSEGLLPDDVHSMRSVYERKCKVDRIEEIRLADCYFGCAIQYITAEAENERLPYYDDKVELCFSADCVLDNRDELMQQLGITDKSTPDGSLIYLSYLKWGIDCVTHLRGLFSFAVYDRKRRKTYLVADHLSNRCLYYYITEEKIVFSTLIEPIKSICKDIEINELYIKDFLTAPGLMPNLISNETPYKDIYKINSGCYMEISQDGCREVEYWSPSLHKGNLTKASPEEYGQKFRRLYEECVHDAIRTSGKVAVAMSSGLDSATVGALAAEELAEMNGEVYAYTYVPYYQEVNDKVKTHVSDERQDVEDIVSLHENIIPHYLNNDGKNCIDEIDKYLEIMEIPFKACVNLPSLGEIYKEASLKGCKVVLSGQAGNSTVSHGYIDDVLYDLYSKRKYVTFLKYLNQYSKTVKESRKQALKGCIGYFNYSTKVYKDNSFKYTCDNSFLKDTVLENYPQEERYRKAGVTIFDRVPLPEAYYKSMLYKKAIYTYLGELDTKMGLYHNILLRDPTRDMRMLQFCYDLPYELFAYNGVPRWLIRGNCRDLLSGRLIDDWMRYGVQNIDWVKRIERDWSRLKPQLVSILCDEGVYDLLKVEEVEKFIKEFAHNDESEKELQLQELLFVYIVLRYINNKRN